jgi:hypothetical protein
VNSSAIVTIDASPVLNVIAFVNLSNQIFLNWRYDRKNFLSWKLDCDSNCGHRIQILQNGVITVTCELTDTFILLFFNLRGTKLASLTMKGRLVKLIPITTKLAETFVIITKANRKVKIVSGTDFKVCKVLEQRPYPELVAAIDDSRRLLLVEGIRKGPGPLENHLVVVSF